MTHAQLVPVGVFVEREAIDHPWQDHRWRIAEVRLDPPPLAQGEPQPATGRFHAANLEIELHRKETASYKLNLEGGEPSVYVVVREESDPDAAAPVCVTLVTASPDEAQAYGESGFETVERVAMPPGLLPMLQAFIAEHHVEEPFIKRKRARIKDEVEELFGQEPVFARARPAPGRGNGSDDEQR